MKSKNRIHIMTFILAVLLTFLDQITKLLSIQFLKNSHGISLIKNILELQYLENNGMAFGLLQGKRLFFILFCFIFLSAACYFFYKLPGEKYYLPMRICVLLIFSGALGNLLDRLFRGYVVDFIYFTLIDFPIFNLADIWVVCGGIGTMYLIFFVYKDTDFQFLNVRKRG